MRMRKFERVKLSHFCELAKISINRMSNKKHNDNSEGGFLWVAAGTSLAIIGAWYYTYYKLNDLEPTERGTFGDMFGSVNALFSGLALAGIILTILLQRKELKLQREELQDTRAEFETQNETLKLQRFENTFFNLLNQQHQIVNAIDFRYYKTKEKERRSFRMRTLSATVDQPSEEKEVVIINGRDVFRYLYNQMIGDLKKDEKSYEKIYPTHYERAQTDFGHYFRSLYRMIKIVHETDFFYDISQVSQEQIFAIKYKYISIIRAQLSDYELLWLFYNCLSENGIEKFKPLIEEYSLFKNLPKRLLAYSNHISLYKDTAFTPKNTSAKISIANSGA